MNGCTIEVWIGHHHHLSAAVHRAPSSKSLLFLSCDPHCCCRRSLSRHVAKISCNEETARYTQRALPSYAFYLHQCSTHLVLSSDLLCHLGASCRISAANLSACSSLGYIPFLPPVDRHEAQLNHAHTLSFSIPFCCFPCGCQSAELC